MNRNAAAVHALLSNVLAQYNVQTKLVTQIHDRASIIKIKMHSFLLMWFLLAHLHMLEVSSPTKLCKSTTSKNTLFYSSRHNASSITCWNAGYNNIPKKLPTRSEFKTNQIYTAPASWVHFIFEGCFSKRLQHPL